VQPPSFKPSITLPPGAVPKVAFVHKTEEKGSDVSLGVHLVRGGCEDFNQGCQEREAVEDAEKIAEQSLKDLGELAGV
jgi:hypothetical protein